MTTLQEVEQAALGFSPRDRAVLAAHLLQSLPEPLDDDTDEVVLARQRDAELDADPSAALNLEQFRATIAR